MKKQLFRLMLATCAMSFFGASEANETKPLVAKPIVFMDLSLIRKTADEYTVWENVMRDFEARKEVLVKEYGNLLRKESNALTTEEHKEFQYDQNTVFNNINAIGKLLYAFEERNRESFFKKIEMIAEKIAASLGASAVIDATKEAGTRYMYPSDNYALYINPEYDITKRVITELTNIHYTPGNAFQVEVESVVAEQLKKHYELAASIESLKKKWNAGAHTR